MCVCVSMHVYSAVSMRCVHACVCVRVVHHNLTYQKLRQLVTMVQICSNQAKLYVQVNSCLHISAFHFQCSKANFLFYSLTATACFTGSNREQSSGAVNCLLLLHYCYYYYYYYYYYQISTWTYSSTKENA